MLLLIIVESKSELPGDIHSTNECEKPCEVTIANKNINKLRWVRTSILFIFIELISKNVHHPPLELTFHQNWVCSVCVCVSNYVFVCTLKSSLLYFLQVIVVTHFYAIHLKKRNDLREQSFVLLSWCWKKKKKQQALMEFFRLAMRWWWWWELRP